MREDEGGRRKEEGKGRRKEKEGGRRKEGDRESAQWEGSGVG